MVLDLYWQQLIIYEAGGMRFIVVTRAASIESIVSRRAWERSKLSERRRGIGRVSVTLQGYAFRRVSHNHNPELREVVWLPESSPLN